MDSSCTACMTMDTCTRNLGMLLQHSEEKADSYWKGAFLADGGGDGKAVEDRVDACILLFVMMIINCS